MSIQYLLHKSLTCFCCQAFIFTLGWLETTEASRIVRTFKPQWRVEMPVLSFGNNNFGTPPLCEFALEMMSYPTEHSPHTPMYTFWWLVRPLPSNSVIDNSLWIGINLQIAHTGHWPNDHWLPLDVVHSPGRVNMLWSLSLWSEVGNGHDGCSGRRGIESVGLCVGWSGRRVWCGKWSDQAIDADWTS